MAETGTPPLVWPLLSRETSLVSPPSLPPPQLGGREATREGGGDRPTWLRLGTSDEHLAQVAFTQALSARWSLTMAETGTPPLVWPPSQLRGSYQIATSVVSATQGPRWLRIGTSDEDLARIYFAQALSAVATMKDPARVGQAAIDAAIRRAYEKDRPSEALRKIASIWETIDRSAELAEARSNLLLRKITPPDLAPLPSWLDEQVPALRTHDDDAPGCNPSVVEVTTKLVRACLLIPGAKKLRAELSKGPLGLVLVDWEVSPNRLQWLVGPTALPWPGLTVYFLSRYGTGSDAKRETRIFHNAFDVLDYFREQLRR
jgi:hypothetical protein